MTPSTYFCLRASQHAPGSRAAIVKPQAPAMRQACRNGAGVMPTMALAPWQRNICAKPCLACRAAQRNPARKAVKSKRQTLPCKGVKCPQPSRSPVVASAQQSSVPRAVMASQSSRVGAAKADMAQGSSPSAAMRRKGAVLASGVTASVQMRAFMAGVSICRMRFLPCGGLRARNAARGIR